jgi:hypothetical protein
MASRTIVATSSETSGELFTTRETLACETPAARAMSIILTVILLPLT